MKTEQLPAELEQVRVDLAAWRRQRRRGERIPEAMWSRAGRAVGPCGLNRVSRTLGLNYYTLKRWAGRCRAVRRSSGVPSFVELPALWDSGVREAPSAVGCVVELEKGNGTRLRICVREASGVDWGKLTAAFLGA